MVSVLQEEAFTRERMGHKCSLAPPLAHHATHLPTVSLVYLNTTFLQAFVLLA